MYKKYEVLSHQRLLAILDYDPLTGEFRWKKVVGSQRPMAEGAIAGTTDKQGARVIAINGYLYYAHILAWFYFYRVWPTKFIDHKNLNKAHNAIGNLRVATRSQNNANTRARRHNRLGVKGVRRHGNKFVAQITIKKQRVHIGSFETPTAAHAAYLARAKEAFGEYARGD